MLREAPADVVCIATPAPTHVPITRAVIERGVRGLLVEKPLSLDAASAGALLDEMLARLGRLRRAGSENLMKASAY